MNCVLERRENAHDFVPLIGCLQGQFDLSSASTECLADAVDKDWYAFSLYLRLEAAHSQTLAFSPHRLRSSEFCSCVFRLLQCATSRRGRHLLALAGQRTAALGEAFNFVPWVTLNGKRDIDIFYALLENVCKRLTPTPIECQTETENQIQRV